MIVAIPPRSPSAPNAAVGIKYSIFPSSPVAGASRNQIRPQTRHEYIKIRCFGAGTNSLAQVTRTACAEVVATFPTIDIAISRTTLSVPETKALSSAVCSEKDTVPLTRIRDEVHGPGQDSGENVEPSNPHPLGIRPNGEEPADQHTEHLASTCQ